MVVDDTPLWPTGSAPSPEWGGAKARAAVMATYALGGLEDDPELVDIARLSAELCGTPTALVSIVEQGRQHFLARYGTDLRQTPDCTSICRHAMTAGGVMVIPDTTGDPRFADMALVTGSPHIRFYAGAPLVSDEGAPMGSLCVIDAAPRPAGLTEQQCRALEVLARATMRRLRAERDRNVTAAELADSQAQLKAAFDTMPVLAWVADKHGNLVFANRRVHEMTGLGPGALPAIVDLFHAEDRPSLVEIRRDALARGVPFAMEARMMEAGGTWRWMMMRAHPQHDADGNLVRWFATATDVDASHRLSESRDILASELSHRIKNIFAVISGLVALSARRHPGAREFADQLMATIRALGRAHDYVRPVDGQNATTLHGLLSELSAPYMDEDFDRFRIDGEECEIGQRAATPLALVFHELATNSAKYGALSMPEGRIDLSIRRAEDGRIAIAWRELGGPPAIDTGRTGFGSRLVEMAVTGQLGGSIERQWHDDGLMVDLVIPASAIET